MARGAVVAATIGLAGCSGDSESSGPATITVTREESSAAAATVTPVPADPTTSATPTALPLINRSFDVALVTSFRMQGEDIVLVIDRLTAAGIEDAALASSGVPVQPDAGDRFGNQREAFYEVGVADTAVFVRTSCTRGADGVQQTSQPLTADDFVASVPADAPVIIAYTNGLVSRAEVNPRC